MATLEWRIVPPEEVKDAERNRCTARRGPRSRVQCEQDSRHHADFHAGRGERGQWFHWADNGVLGPRRTSM